MANSPSIGKLRMFLDDHLMSTFLYRKYCLWILRNWFETKTSQVTFGQFLMPRIHKLLVASLVWNRSNALEVKREKRIKVRAKVWPKRELEAGPIWREGSQCPFLANHQTFDVLVYFLCGSLAFQYMSGLFQAYDKHWTNVEYSVWYKTWNLFDAVGRVWGSRGLRSGILAVVHPPS